MIKSGQDFWTGLFFLAMGIFILAAGWNLPMGTASRMLQGFFPGMVASLLCLVGVILCIKGMIVPGAPAPRFAVRSMLPLIAVVAFGLLLRPAGLAIAVSILIFVSSFGLRFKLLEAGGLSLFMIVFIWLVFVKGLGLPLQLWPGF
ncbi:MAG: tripartite tricarboxylate transporter TctB family protein [Candidatus Accumulibacter sp.]|jgi:hypothetical protein|nr:tripartite tricarboxylate transporter TctB family protein [Accumulibacter sp.]